MRYLKLFENFIHSGGDTQPAPSLPPPSSNPSEKPGWAPPFPTGVPGQRKFERIENTKLYNVVLSAVQSKMSDPEFDQLFDKLERSLSNVDPMKMEAIFKKEWDSSEFLDEELLKYNESFDVNKLAKDALIYLGSIGAIAIVVKLFYMLGNITFQHLDQGGFSTVAGGVLLILIYLAFFHKVKKKNVQVEEEEDDELSGDDQSNQQKAEEILRNLMSKFRK